MSADRCIVEPGNRFVESILDLVRREHRAEFRKQPVLDLGELDRFLRVHQSSAPPSSLTRMAEFRNALTRKG